jgi:UDP-N-acetylmuramate--alanine ligase
MAYYHLTGAGGVGMSALAVSLKGLGNKVTGSDRNLSSPNVKLLESQGIKCFPDDGMGVVDGVDALVVSTAIEKSNLDFVAAKEKGIPILHRADALSQAIKGFKLVAVAGTCGKSTVTAMLGHILSECGLDPFCVNGANVPGWTGAVRFGKGEYAVVEVDESDKSLLRFSPYTAIVTNSSSDHYPKEEMDRVFDSFIEGVEGPVVDGRKESLKFDLSVPLPGRHNRENASAAFAMALKLGCDEAMARAAIATFRGVERRLQKYGKCVYDDYAHNPEKLKAMFQAVAEAHPQGPICIIWRPHGYGPLKKMLDDLAIMFNETLRKDDRLLLLPVYDVGGTADRTVDSSMLTAKIDEGKAVLVKNYEAVVKYVETSSGFSAYCVCGARDVQLPLLAQMICNATEGGG